MNPILIPITFAAILGNFIIDDIILLAHDTIKNVIAWMRSHGAHRMRCRCGEEMYQTKSTHYQDGYEWRYTPCRGRCSLRQRSFFTPSHLTLPLLLKFIYYSSEEIQSHAFLEKHLGWSPNAVVDWKKFLRDICVEELLVNPEPIGGVGTIVEIDESKFGKRKYNRGRLLTGQLLFGMVERDTDKMVMVTVPDRSATTQLPIIQTFVLPGTIMYSDECASYNI